MTVVSGRVEEVGSFVNSVATLAETTVMVVEL